MTLAAACRTSGRDKDLSLRFARETEPLFDVLIRRARQLTRCEADAEDLVQDTLLHAYRGFHTFEVGSNLKGWLLRILYNRWVSAYRSRQSRPAEVFVDGISDLELIADTARASAELRSAENVVLDALPDSAVQTAMRALPDGFGVVLYLAEVEGYTYSETATILGIPPGTVMSRIARGRRRLRAALLTSHDRPTTDFQGS